MTTVVLSLIFTLSMIMITKIPVAYAMNKRPGGYDNRHPRSQQAALEGFGVRALGAHQNSLEALPMFASAALITLVAQADPTQIEWLCITFVLARIVYTLSYLANQHLLRSTAWSVGFFACIALMAIAL